MSYYTKYYKEYVNSFGITFYFKYNGVKIYVYLGDGKEIKLKFASLDIMRKKLYKTMEDIEICHLLEFINDQKIKKEKKKKNLK